MKTFAALLGILIGIGAQDKDTWDKIVWKGNRPPTEGVVISLNVKEIKYRLATGGGEQVEPSKGVQDIVFDPESLPYEFNAGKAALQRNQFREAVEQFEKAIDRIKRSNNPNHPLRDFCRKFIIEAQLAAGDTAGVVAAARELRKEKLDSFYVRDSFLLQYEAAKTKGDAKLLDETMKEFEEAIQKDRRLSELAAGAELLRADANEMAGKFEPALATYSKYQADREVWETVSLGTLRCLSALNRIPDLKNKTDSLFNELKREENPRVLLGAMTARGDIRLSEGKVREALLDYLKGLLELGPKVGDTPEHEAAMAKSAIASARYALEFAKKDDKENRDRYLGRARELKDELKRTFPRTGWMTEVEKLIREAGAAQ